jgi:adenylate cyclase
MSEGTQRRLAAIVSADVVGYSRLMGVDEAGTLAALRNHRAELIDGNIAEHGGRIVKTMGDGLLLEFPSVVDATQCVIDVQQAMAGRNEAVDEDKRIVFRIGVHLGDLVVEGDDIFGDGINIAARLEAFCEAGGVAISGTAHENIAGRIEVGFVDAGDQQLKNISRPVRVWQWTPRASASDLTIRETTLPLPDKPSIAVLPFDNMSGDPEQEYFSDGITEDIITALCRFRQLVVLARNTCFTYKGRSVDVKLIAGELGVRYVLEGSVRKAGNRVRITVQLIEGASGNHLWAERYDRDLEDIFGVQDEITQVVAGAIEPEITKAEFERVRRTPPSSLDAWSMYQHGMHHFQKFSQENDEEARRFFRAAAALDPDFSAPHAIIARTYSRSIVTELPENLEEQCKLALEEAKIAVALDRDDAFAHASLGFAQLWTDADASIRAFEEALSINLNLAIAHFGIGLAFMSGRQPETAISHLETAIQLSPRDPMSDAFFFEMGTAYFALGDYEACLEWSSKSGFDISFYGRTGTVRMAALALLGHESETKQIREILMNKYPHLTVSHVLKISPFLGADYMKGLRKAGLPEE